MKKRKRVYCTLIAMMMIFRFNVIVNAAEREGLYPESVYLAMSQIQNIEQNELSMKGIYPLYDVNMNQKYQLLDFETGYAIITNNGVISEYNMNSNNPYNGIDISSMKCIYAGPGSYYIDSYDSNFETDLFLKESSNNVVKNFDDIKLSNEMETISGNLTSKSVDNITALDLNTWVGIRETTMYKYKDWINTDSICGSYATATMLCYYQDYVDSEYVPSSYRNRFSSIEPRDLIDDIAGYASDYGMGTSCNMLSSAIYWFLHDNTSISENSDYETLAVRSIYSKSYQYDVLDSNVIYSINNSRPCVIELYSSSSYGAHFVLAYQYYEQGDYNYLFKIVDNWGNHTATISNEWVRGWVRITDV